MKERDFLHIKIAEFVENYEDEKIKIQEQSSQILYAILVFYKKHFVNTNYELNLNGIYSTELNLEKMFETFYSAAEVEDVDSYWRNPDRATEYWEVYYFIGECLLNGYGTEKDINKAREYFKIALYSIINGTRDVIPLLSYEIKDNYAHLTTVRDDKDWKRESYNIDAIVDSILEAMLYFADYSTDDIKIQNDNLIKQLVKKDFELQHMKIEFKKEKDEMTKKFAVDVQKMNEYQENITKELDVANQKLAVYKAKENAQKIIAEAQASELQRLKDQQNDLAVNPYRDISKTIIDKTTAGNKNLFNVKTDDTEAYGEMKFGEVVQYGGSKPAIGDSVEIKLTPNNPNVYWLILEVSQFPILTVKKEKEIKLYELEYEPYLSKIKNKKIEISNKNDKEVTVSEEIEVNYNGVKLIFPNPITFDDTIFSNYFMGIYDICDEDYNKLKTEEDIKIRIITPCVVSKQGYIESKGMIELAKHG